MNICTDKWLQKIFITSENMECALNLTMLIRGVPKKDIPY